MSLNRIRRVVPTFALAGALLAFVLAGAAGAASPPVGDWRMNEGSGTVLVDSSASGNNGTILGNPTWVAGQHGQAIRFDGTGDYATVPDNASLDISGCDHDGRLGEAGEDGDPVPDQEGDHHRDDGQRLRALAVDDREGVRALQPGRRVPTPIGSTRRPRTRSRARPGCTSPPPTTGRRSSCTSTASRRAGTSPGRPRSSRTTWRSASERSRTARRRCRARWTTSSSTTRRSPPPRSRRWRGSRRGTRRRP